MKNVLIVSGHTDLQHSFANKAILDALQQRLPEATYRFLDQVQTDYQFDIAIEQQHLVAADIIVLQFPFFWYGVPSLMKKWIEDVFIHGFSHGSTGDKVRGKVLLLSFTSGAPEEMYREGGPQGFPIDDFLPPLKQFAALTGMTWGGFVYSGALSYASRHDVEQQATMHEKALAHADTLYADIVSLAG